MLYSGSTQPRPPPFLLLLLIAAGAVGHSPSPEATGRAATTRPSWEASHYSSMWTKVETAAGSARGSGRWGHVLDAGSGASSLGWLGSLPCESVVAVTAASATLLEMKAVLKDNKLLTKQQTSHMRVIRSNWLATGGAALPAALSGPFDTIVMDYMFGALEHFSPFGEHQLLGLLKARLAPGGVLIVVGKQPLPYPNTQGGLGRKRWDALAQPLQIILETERVRDTAMLLAQQRPYREFPRAAVEEAVAGAGFEVAHTFELPIDIHSKTVEGQLDWAVRAAEGECAHFTNRRANRAWILLRRG